MIASGPPPNQLLRMLDAVNFDLLRPHLITIELVRETVLGEAGVALQHVHFPNDGGEGGVIATIAGCMRVCTPVGIRRWGPQP